MLNLLLPIAALIFALTATNAANAETCGQLAAVKGSSVEVLRLQAGRDAEIVRYAIRVQDGQVMPLECDDVVIAGQDSSAKVILASGKLSLAPDSRIELAAHTKVAGDPQPQVTLINLTYGKMRALVRKRADEQKPAAGPQSSHFRVRTFSATAGVRGTDFFTSYDPNSGLMEQATIDGSVEVQQAGTVNKAVVNAGFQTSVEVTPAALTAALENNKTSKQKLEPPRELPSAKQMPVALQVVPLRDSTRNQIRLASVIAKDDQDFTQKKAVETLGAPATWTYEREKVPEHLKNIKNEF